MIVINRATQIVSLESVKQALECLDEPAALGLSVLMQLPFVTTRDSAGELRDLLLDVIAEMAEARTPRDAESGRLLVDYYIKKAGSHEVIRERLRLTRTTYYRRLHRGYGLIAQELDRVSKFVIRFQH